MTVASTAPPTAARPGPAVNTGLTGQRINALAINPVTPTTLYAGTYDRGLYRSTDSGTTWTGVNTGLTGQRIYALAINPVTPTTLHAGTLERGVFRTTDSGATWTGGEHRTQQS